MTMRLRLLPAVVLLAMAGCGDAPAPTTAVLPSVAVVTAPATLVGQAGSELLPGTVRAARAVTLQARVPGAVARIAATPGQQVEAGALLVELDALEIAAKRDQARAAAAAAAADYARISQLFSTQSVTKAEFDAAKARADGSAAAAAEAEIMVGYTRMNAPFAGVVVRKHAELGDLLAPGRPVIELEDPASLRLEVEVPESLAGRIAVSGRLRVQIAAARLDAEAEIVEVTPAADPVSRTVLAKLALPADLPALRSGQFGRVAVPTVAGEVLSVPAAALVRRGQLDAVFVVVDGVARLRLVRLGGPEGDRVTVRAGLAAGDVVVLDPGDLRDGQPVTLR